MTRAMTHAGCPNCRLRVTPATAADLGACPECGETLRAFAPRATLGFRLVELGDIPHSLPRAVAVAIPISDPGGARP
jgi:hypothetical protein